MGRPVLPGKPEESLIFQRIFEPNPARRMPPLLAHRDLIGVQKETIRRWSLLKTWKSRSAPGLDSGTKPSSSMISFA